MKNCSLIALVLTAGLFSSAEAAEINATSKVDAVTVYPQGADVTRLVSIDLPADESVLKIDNVPSSADPNSIRVEGAGEEAIEVSSVDSKARGNEDVEKDALHEKLSEQIETLRQESAGLDQDISDKEAERKLLLDLVARQGSAKPLGGTLNAAAIDGVIGSVATRLADTTKSIKLAKERQRIIAKEIAKIEQQVAEAAPDTSEHLQVMIHVRAAKPTHGEFRLSYRVPEAAWHAIYDAKLALPRDGQDAKIALVRQASIEQNTGEDWRGVSLTLSTAKPSGSAAAPNLPEAMVSKFVPPPPPARPAVNGGVVANTKTMDVEKFDEMADVPMAQPAPRQALKRKESKPVEAEPQIAGFTAQYKIVDRTDIDNVGTAKIVRIGTDDLKAKISVEAVPRLDLNAYLTAAFTVKSDQPLLAGPVRVFRDEAYVGLVQIGELAGGEDTKLGFGIDDMVKVKRTEIKRLAAQEGIITTSNTQETGWIISVNNLHDTKMPVRVLDRKPFSTDQQITVTDRADNTVPSVVDVEHKRGVLAYDLTMEPKSKAEIKTGYKVSAPKDIQLSLTD